MSRRTETAGVLAFPRYTEPAARLAQLLDWSFSELSIHSFPDGESLVRLPETVPEHVVLYVGLDQANHQLVELELAAATALNLGARRLTLVAPYLCYMRQDRAFHPGEAVSQHVVGAWLARRFDTVITVDPHLHRTHRLVDAVPVRRAVVVTAASLMAEWLSARGGNPLLIGPDAESAPWLKAIAEKGDFEYIVGAKQRAGDRDVTIKLPEVAVAGRPVVLIDDVASTGRTLAEVARQVNDRGAASVTVLVTHALFVGDALDCLRATGVGEIVSTDSVRHPTNRLQLAGLLAETLREA